MLTKIPRLRRCACSQLATIRTVWKNGLVESIAFHCGDICRNRWIESTLSSTVLITSTIFDKDGFKTEEVLVK